MFHGLKLKINLNAFTAGHLAQTPLGSLGTELPQTRSWKAGWRGRRKGERQEEEE